MRRRLITIATAVALVGAVAAGGFVWAAGDDDDANLTGPAADKARAAALARVQGRVVGVERENEEGIAFEVEIRRPDGSLVEVMLDADHRVVSTGSDDDEGGDD